MKIRPRIFLEGNFFVDLKPGTPAAPTHRRRRHDPGHPDGDAGAARPGADRAPERHARRTCRSCSTASATALTYKPPTARGRRRRPSARGQSAAESLNDAIRYGARGAEAARRSSPTPSWGPSDHDLSRLIAGLSRTTRGPGPQRGAAQGPRHELQHARWRRSRRRPATCARRSACSAPTLAERRPGARLAQRRLPATRARSRARSCPASARRRPRSTPAFPWIAQARGLLGPSRAAAAWSSELQPGDGGLAQVIDATLDAAAAGRPGRQAASRNVILPTGDVKIHDGALTTGAENYKEFWYTMVGLAGEGQNFDGNGKYVRFQPGGGDQTVSHGPDARRPATRCSATRSSSRSARGPPSRASARRTSPTSPATRNPIPTSTAPPTAGRAGGDGATTAGGSRAR